MTQQEIEQEIQKVLGNIVGFYRKCSFCKKHQRQVEVLIQGEGALICNECVALCVEIVTEEKKKKVEGK